MFFMNNIAITRVIPFSICEMVNYYSLLEGGVLARGILIPGSEDKNLSLSTAKKLNFSCPPEIGSPFLYHLAALLLKWNY